MFYWSRLQTTVSTTNELQHSEQMQEALLSRWRSFILNSGRIRMNRKYPDIVPQVTVFSANPPNEHETWQAMCKSRLTSSFVVLSYRIMRNYSQSTFLCIIPSKQRFDGVYLKRIRIILYKDLFFSFQRMEVSSRRRHLAQCSSYAQTASCAWPQQPCLTGVVVMKPACMIHSLSEFASHTQFS